MNVLVEHIVSIDRGQQYANKLNQPAIWSRLGKAQLDGLRVKDAIDSYVKAEDPSNYEEVIEIAEHAGREEELIRYLQMARKKAREPKIDTEYAYCLAKANRLGDMEEFLGMTNVADILSVGEKCFNDELSTKQPSCFSPAFPTMHVSQRPLSISVIIRVLLTLPARLETPVCGSRFMQLVSASASSSCRRLPIGHHPACRGAAQLDEGVRGGRIL